MQENTKRPVFNRETGRHEIDGIKFDGHFMAWKLEYAPETYLKTSELNHLAKPVPLLNVNANNMISGQAIYHAINQVRAEHHERALSPDTCLVKEANRRAKEVALKFAHAHNPFCSRSISGENLSKGYKTTESVKNAWMRSETHRENLLWKDYKRTGIGIYQQDGVTYVAQLFSN